MSELNLEQKALLRESLELRILGAHSQMLNAQPNDRERYKTPYRELQKQYRLLYGNSYQIPQEEE